MWLLVKVCVCSLHPYFLSQCSVLPLSWKFKHFPDLLVLEIPAKTKKTKKQ